MRSFCSFVFLMSSVAAAISQQIVLTDETGTISSENGRDFAVRVPKGKKIVAEIHSLVLKNGFLKLKDGLTGRVQVFQSSGSSFLSSPEDRSSNPEVVSLPIRFQTITRKLLVDFRADSPSDEQFSLRYASFTEDGTCAKEHLRSMFSDAQITCESDALVPVATSCDVTLQCGENYNQYGKRMICLDGQWEGRVKCLPRSDLIEECSFDFENIDSDNDCVFTAEEVTNYYIDVEDVTELFESDLGRGNGRSINCQPICRRTGQRYTVNCGRRNCPLVLYIKCLICRRGYGCRVPTVVMA